MVSWTTDVQSICRHSLLAISGLALITIVGCSGGDSPDTSASPKSSKPAKAETAKAETPSAEPTEAAAKPEVATADAPAAKPSETPKPAAKKAVDPSAVGSFSGTVVLDGEAPKLAALTKAGDENLKDKEVCGKADVPDESVIVGEGNGIANVFVYLRRAPKGYKSEVPAEAVVLDQKGCVFTPHVAMIQAGQKVLVKSSDAVQHNVHTFPARNQGTNLLIKPNERVGVELTYTRPESDPLQVKCDIHAWMSSYHLVLDHPFMAITDANGKFKIDGLPAGDYEFRVWHEKGGVLNKGYANTVTGEDDAVELKFPADKFAG